MDIKSISKWARKWHRILGFFFLGTSLVYGFSGIALNHLNDWNPNYTVESFTYTPVYNFSNKDSVSEYIPLFLSEINLDKEYKTYAYTTEGILKIYLNGGSSIVIDLSTRVAKVELLKKRLMFYQFNFLHYNPHNWWKWFSDAFALSLIFFALSSIVMVRGKNGWKGKGGIFIAAGIIIPIILYFV